MAKVPKPTKLNVSVATPEEAAGRPSYEPGSLEPNQVLWAPQAGPQTMAMLAKEFEIFYGGAKFGGKAGSVDSKVSTPFGFKRMGDVEVGDQVSNPLGSVARVIAIHPQGEQDVFRVRFNDGAETLVTNEHLWLARLTARKMKADRRYYDGDRQINAKIYTTAWLKEFLEKNSERERDEYGNGAPGVLIPLTEPVEYTRADWQKVATFDPYALGLLLGDGCLRQNAVMLSAQEPELVAAIQARTGVEFRQAGPSDWRMNGPGRTVQELTRLGVYGKLAHEKSIPEIYLTAPVSVRREVIQGLMDTDGYVDSRGHCSYTSVSPSLARQFQLMARSLGYKATMTEGEAGYKNRAGDFVQCRNAFTVYLQGNVTKELFKLSRKRERCLDLIGTRDSSRPYRRITSITSAGRQEAKCITVDHPNGLYVTDDFIVTHNSYCIIGWLLKGNPEVPLDKATPMDISYINCGQYRALVVRKNLDDLNSWISEANQIYSKLGANYTQKPNEFTFPSGAKIVLGHLNDDHAVEKYFGNVVHRAAVDELTFIAERKNYMKLYSCVRSNIKGIKAQMLLTGNPGGPGTAWVMDRFVEPKDERGDIIPPLTRIVETSWNPFLKTMIDQTRIFIPSKIADNPKGIATDPTYYNRLMGMDDAERLAYLEGDWHSLGGTFFADFRSKHRESEPPEACHVIEPGSRRIEPWYPRFAAMDWGYGHEGAFLVGVKTPHKQVIVTKEIVRKGTGSIEWGYLIGKALVEDLNGLKRAGIRPSITIWLSPDAAGKRDEYKTQAEGIAEGIGRVLGPEAVYLSEYFKNPSAVGEETFFEQSDFQAEAAVQIRKAQNARVAGADHCREMLRWRQLTQAPQEAFDPVRAARLRMEDDNKFNEYVAAFKRREPEILPKCLIASECIHLIQSIPSLVHDDSHFEDVLKTEAISDQLYDAWRYLLHSENVAQNREPKQSFVERHIERHGAALTYNDKVFMALKATEDYEAADEDMRPFRLRAASSHQLQ